MARQAKAALGAKQLDVVADRGYFRSEEILACHRAGINAYVPKSLTSNNLARGFYDRRDFIYKPEDDEYECPAGERLIYRFTRQEQGKELRRYWSTACDGCIQKSRCTTGQYRRVSRWQHEAVLEAAQQRLDASPEHMRVRRSTVEHPFGTLKSWMGHTHFLTRTLPRVSTEMSLHVLAYNLKRVMAILGPQSLIAAMRA
jgi:hypothetical protein